MSRMIEAIPVTEEDSFIDLGSGTSKVINYAEYLQGVSKNDPSCFCQNLGKSPPNSIIFGTQIAKTTTSPSLCQ